MSRLNALCDPSLAYSLILSENRGISAPSKSTFHEVPLSPNNWIHMVTHVVCSDFVSRIINGNTSAKST